MKAAGVLFVSSGKVLLLQRSASAGDHPNTWGLPGGHIEEGETPDAAAARECTEELGYTPDGKLEFMGACGEFATFIRLCDQFPITLNDEHTAAVWADISDYPAPLHPGLDALLNPETLEAAIRESMTEMDAAKYVRDGLLTSPTRFGNMSLFAMRITGTGTAYRSKDRQYVYRRPENYLCDDFLERCNGLPVIFEHPDKNTLNSKEYNERNVGSIVLPYLNGNEVWGIAKIYDDETVTLLEQKQMSTSPTVVFHNPEINSTLALENGNTLLIEGKPKLLDHLAICELGVWDKGGDPAGVISENLGAKIMTDAELKAKADAEAAETAKAKADAETGDKLDKLLTCVDSLSKRMDSFEASKAEGETKQTAADKAKADAEEAEKKEAEETAKADAQAKADSEAVQKQIAEINSKMPKQLSDADYAAMADAQAKADSVASAFGDSASRPLQGEDVLSYRKRLASGFKKHSKVYSAIDLYAIADSALFEIAEKQIYADAADVAMHPVDVAEGVLREIKTRDNTGRVISTFVGKPDVWMSQFKSPKRRLSGINKGV